MFRKPPTVKIRTSLQYEQQQARIAAGLSLAEYAALPGSRRWIDPDSPVALSKCCVIMLYRINNQIGAVQEDARARKKR